MYIENLYIYRERENFLEWVACFNSLISCSYFLTRRCASILTFTLTSLFTFIMRVANDKVEIVSSS